MIARNENMRKKQCKALKLSKEQCTRSASKDYEYCWQHRFSRINDASWYNNTKIQTLCTVITIIGLPFAIYEWKTGPTKFNQNEIIENTDEIKENTTLIVKMLQEELSIKNVHIEFLQSEIIRLQNIMPSDRALQLAKQIPDNATPYALALKAIAERRYDDARKFLDKAQEQKEIELADVYKTHGQIEFYAGNYDDSAKWYEKAITLSPNDIKLIIETALIFLDNAMFDKVEPLLLKIFDYMKEKYGFNHPNVARAMNNLVVLYLQTNRIKDAEDLSKQVIKIFENSYGKNHTEVAISMSNLALLYKDTNRFEEAESLMVQALDIYENTANKDSYKNTLFINNLASFYIETDRLTEAEPLLVRALEIDKQTLGKNNPNVATHLNNLALLYRSTGRSKESELLLISALEIDEICLGKNHPNIARDLTNLALLYNTTNKSEEAVDLLIRVLKIDENTFGPNHPNVALDLNNLAQLYKDNNRLKEAELFMERSMEIMIGYTRKSGYQHPKLKNIIKNYANLHLLLGENEEQISNKLRNMIPEIFE
jgi:tetratricopeptide (TPR) repeat protein